MLKWLIQLLVHVINRCGSGKTADALSTFHITQHLNNKYQLVDAHALRAVAPVPDTRAIRDHPFSCDIVHIQVAGSLAMPKSAR